LKTQERYRARKLRNYRGYSIKQIAVILGVSKSSVSLWVRDIALTEEQHEALRQRNPIYNAQLAGRGATSTRRRAERTEYQKHGRLLAEVLRRGRRADPPHLPSLRRPRERQREIERFWLRITGLSEASLCRSVVNVYSKYSARKRVNKLPYGTCRVVVNRTSVVQSIYGSIQEYGAFERPAWLG
jgi:transcriptional regulator with XRE-family HTH domain